jgi:hypothetical protein
MLVCDNISMEFQGIHSLDSFTINPKEKSTLANKEDAIAVHFVIQSLFFFLFFFFEKDSKFILVQRLHTWSRLHAYCM